MSKEDNKNPDSNKKNLGKWILFIVMGVVILYGGGLAMNYFQKDNPEWKTEENYQKNLKWISHLEKCDDFKDLPNWSMGYDTVEHKKGYKPELEKKFSELKCDESYRDYYEFLLYKVPPQLMKDYRQKKS